MFYRKLRQRHLSLEAGQPLVPTDQHAYELGDRPHGKSKVFGTVKQQDDTQRRLSSQQDRFPEIKRLLSWYKRAAGTTQSHLLRNSLWINTSNGELCAFDDSETVSACFAKILVELQSPKRAGLRICAICASSEGPIYNSYSFPYEVYLTLSRKVHDAARVFHLRTARLLTIEWAQSTLEQDIIERLISRPSPESVSWAPDLPSNAQQQHKIDLATRSQNDASTMLQPPKDLNAASWTDTFYLEWQWLSDTVNYNHDVDIYVWEPFKQKPSLDYVRIVVLRQVDLMERRLVVVASSSTILLRLGKIQLGRADPMSALDPSEAEMLIFFTQLYQMIRDDIVMFLTKASTKVHQLVCAQGQLNSRQAAYKLLMQDMKSRSNPSRWKLQLLNHIQECCLTVAEYNDKNIRTLDMILAKYDARVAQDLVLCKTDLKYLNTQLRKKASAITTVKKSVKEQMEIVSNYQQAVIAVLVALYVPISFVSSFLGMNISDRSPDSYWRNITHEMLPVNTTTHSLTVRNMTVEQIRTNNLSTKTWSLNSFWASAFPLAFGTIVLPLVAGPIFRWLAQFARRHRVWWRVVVMFVVVIVIMGMNLLPVGVACRRSPDLD